MQQAESAQPLRSREQSLTAAQKLWEILTEYYTDKFIKKNGEVPSSTWITEIGLLSDEQLRRGVIACRDNIRRGDQWPPDLSGFLALIHGQDETNFDMAYSRMIAKEPEGRIEQWVYEKAAFNLRRESDVIARRNHKRFMKEAIELERLGKLKLNEEMLKALPPNSVINANDLARQEFEQKNGRSLNPRIQAILDAKKLKGDSDG
ncbi:hypothetical protein VPHD171_0044 [Vibrio phage D171]